MNQSHASTWAELVAKKLTPGDSMSPAKLSGFINGVCGIHAPMTTMVLIALEDSGVVEYTRETKLWHVCCKEEKNAE